MVGFRLHEELNRHCERILPLIEELLAEVGWPASSLDRVGVGIGPGNFTGLRVGVALAQGIALGLDRPAVGIGSLQAMACMAPVHPGPTAAVLDARRDEFFIAIFDANGHPLAAPRAVPQSEAKKVILETAGPSVRFVGEPPVTGGWEPTFQSEDTDLPSARGTARLAAGIEPAEARPIPAYIRGANAIKPHLPPSPLRSD